MRTMQEPCDFTQVQSRNDASCQSCGRDTWQFVVQHSDSCLAKALTRQRTDWCAFVDSLLTTTAARVYCSPTSKGRKNSTAISRASEHRYTVYPTMAVTLRNVRERPHQFHTSTKRCENAMSPNRDRRDQYPSSSKLYTSRTRGPAADRSGPRERRYTGLRLPTMMANLCSQQFS